MLIGGFLGLLIGSVLGMTGAGGGIFAVPALIFGLGMDMQSAAPVALLAVGLAAAVGALQGLRRGIVRYKAAMLLATAGTLTAPFGIWLAHRMPAAWLNLLFVAVMLLVATRMYLASRGGQGNDDDAALLTAKLCRISRETGRFVWTPRTAVILAAVGCVSGLFSGMLGVGGGFIIVPALLYVSELRMHSIVSTSLLVIALLAGFTVSVAWSQGMSPSAPAWVFIAAAVVGMGIGRSLAPKLAPAMLQRLFALACLGVAVMMLLRQTA